MKKNKRLEESALAPSERTGGEITRQDPYSLWADMDRLFDNFRMGFDDIFWPRGSAAPRITSRKMISALPAMDIEDRGADFHIKMDMPGIKKEDVNLEATPTTLSITAESREETKDEDKNYIRQERCSHKYARSLEFGEEIATDKIDAKIEDGVLEITLPKKAPVEIKKVTVNVK